MANFLRCRTADACSSKIICASLTPAKFTDQSADPLSLIMTTSSTSQFSRFNPVHKNSVANASHG